MGAQLAARLSVPKVEPRLALWRCACGLQRKAANRDSIAAISYVGASDIPLKRIGAFGINHGSEEPIANEHSLVPGPGQRLPNEIMSGQEIFPVHSQAGLGSSNPGQTENQMGRRHEPKGQ